MIELCPAPTLPTSSSKRKRPGLSTQDPGKAFCPWGVTCFIYLCSPGAWLPDLTPQENGYRPGEGASHATLRETPAQGGEARLCLALLQASRPGQALTQGPASATQPQSMVWAGPLTYVLSQITFQDPNMVMEVLVNASRQKGRK